MAKTSGIVLMFVLMFTISFVLASAPAPSPVCNIQGVIQSVEFKDAYNESCLTNCADSNPSGTCCPTDTELIHPARYYLTINITNSSYVNGDTNYATCEGFFSISNASIISINKEKIMAGDNFQKGDFITGIVKSTFLRHLDSYNLIKSNCENLYWIDNSNKECGQKQFCGAYMYLGLQTFKDENECRREVVKICPLIERMLPEECLDGNITDNGYNEKGCAKPEVCIHNNKTKTFEFSNGRKAEIKIMPETASQTAIERLGELGFNITLKEVGKGNETKAVYHLTAEKNVKLFGFIKKKAKVEVDVDAENNGNIISVKRPWWSFMASGF